MSTSARVEGRDRVSVLELARPVPLAKPADRIAHFEVLITKCEILADLVTIMTAVLFSYASYRHLALGKSIHYPTPEVLGAALMFAVVFVLGMQASGAYQPGKSLLGVRETERILRLSVQTFLLIFAFGMLSTFLISRWVLVLAFLSVPLLLSIEKGIISWVIRALHAKGHGVRKVMVYGAGLTGRRIFSSLVRSPKLGLEPVAIADDNPQAAGSVVHETSYRRRRSASVLPGPITRDFIRQLGVEEVIVAIPSLGREKFAAICTEATAAKAQVSFVPNHEAPADFWINYADVDGILLASFGQPATSLVYGFFKRIFDLVLGFAILLLAIPLLLGIAALIRIGSPGPVLFTQDRVGKDREIFKMYKFRTMRVDASPYDYSPQSSADPRITPIGRFLRRTSLDELPQIFNVLSGKMSLVGPRPEMPFIVEQYSPIHQQRLQVKPGLTGLWQLSADRAYLIHENIEYDLYYIRHRNLFMDFAILLHTTFFAVRGI
jgi:exopolysaccharide biosynthesis polyprenyl glycosylphosphotransferase